MCTLPLSCCFWLHCVEMGKGLFFHSYSNTYDTIVLCFLKRYGPSWLPYRQGPATFTEVSGVKQSLAGLRNQDWAAKCCQESARGAVGHHSYSCPLSQAKEWAAAWSSSVPNWPMQCDTCGDHYRDTGEAPNMWRLGVYISWVGLISINYFLCWVSWGRSLFKRTS